MDGSNVPNMPNAPYNYATYEASGGYGGSPAIKVGPSAGLQSGEVDGAWVSVSPGDRVTFEAWVRTGTLTPTDLQAGAGFGFDFYGHTSEGYGILFLDAEEQGGHPSGSEKNYGNPNDFGYSINGDRNLSQVSGLTVKVPFNTGWTKVQWDFTVPSITFSYVYTSGVVSCDPVQIDHLVFWTFVNDDGDAWFSNPVMYINPVSPTTTPSVPGTTPNGFYILVEEAGGVSFQSAINKTFTIEVLDGVWDGSDCRLVLNERGGSLYFYSNNNAHVQLSQDNEHIMALSIDGMTATSINPAPLTANGFNKGGYSWNGTITNGAEVQISWQWPNELPYEGNFLFYIGVAGIIMLICGIMLSAYAFRHYKIFTLGNENTIWDKDILPFCILLVIGGICLIAAWLFTGVV